MDELVPVILGVLLGLLISRSKGGKARVVLSALAVIASGVAATVLSGEYVESWIYLLLDLGEAAFGLAIGFGIAHCLSRFRRTAAPAMFSAAGSKDRLKD